MLYDGASDWRRCRSGSMLTSEQRTEFDERGFVRIPSAFTAAEASAMEDLVWAHVEARAGVIRGDPSTWNLTMVVGLGHLKTDPAFAAIGSPATVAALDDVLGEDRWVRPKNWGQLLVTFPTPDAEWTVPSDVWHTDFDYQLPPGEIAGALVFAFLTDVGPGAGGTVVVAGSHRLVRRYVEDQPREALETVGEPLLVNNVARGRELEERVREVIVQVGLRVEHLRRFPHSFSGGQRQRIGIWPRPTAPVTRRSDRRAQSIDGSTNLCGSEWAAWLDTQVAPRETCASWLDMLRAGDSGGTMVMAPTAIVATGTGDAVHAVWLPEGGTHREVRQSSCLGHRRWSRHR